MVLEGHKKCEICERVVKEEYLENGICSKCKEAKEQIEYDGVVVTCGNEDCNNPTLEFDHLWSDGPSRHHWFKCRNCGAKQCFHSNHKKKITSARGMKVLEDPKNKVRS